MGNGFVRWFARSYQGVIVVLVGIMAAALVALALQHVDRSKPAAGAEAAPIPTYTTAPSALSKVDIAKRDQNLQVLYVGDSLTYGAFASVQEKSYRALVDAAINQHTLEASDFVGGSGRSSIDITPEISNKTYDLVIVEVGTNDATNQPSGSIGKNYNDLLNKVRSASPTADLICAGSWQTSYQASKVDGGIAATCRSKGGIYVPLQKLYQNEANRGPDKRNTFYGVADDFHPNDAGHQAIADAVLNRINFK